MTYIGDISIYFRRIFPGYHLSDTLKIVVRYRIAHTRPAEGVRRSDL